MDCFVCARCKKELPRSSFYSRGGGRKRDRAAYCKSCVLEVTLLKQAMFKTKCVEYKGGKCELCLYNKCTAALEFHHKDPKQKEFTFSRFRSQTFGPKVIAELDKCILLCANCHRETHYTKFQEHSAR